MLFLKIKCVLSSPAGLVISQASALNRKKLTLHSRIKSIRTRRRKLRFRVSPLPYAQKFVNSFHPFPSLLIQNFRAKLKTKAHVIERVQI